MVKGWAEEPKVELKYVCDQEHQLLVYMDIYIIRVLNYNHTISTYVLYIDLINFYRQIPTRYFFNYSRK